MALRRAAGAVVTEWEPEGATCAGCGTATARRCDRCAAPTCGACAGDALRMDWSEARGDYVLTLRARWCEACTSAARMGGMRA